MKWSMVPNTRSYLSLYRDLIERDIKTEKGRLYPFFCQVGKHYFSNKTKILFVGKSVNGWVTTSRNVDHLFDKQYKNRIVNRHDQLEWVNDHPTSTNSAFWRVVRGVASEVLASEYWYHEIAWTNLYKVSPYEGNPSTNLRRRQLETCARILQLDLQTLMPDFVVFLTSDWENRFFEILGHGIDKRKFRRWDKYKTYYYQSNGRLLIHSRHPQGKPEASHIEAICQIIKNRLLY